MKNVKIILALICSGFCGIQAQGQVLLRDMVFLGDEFRDWNIIWDRGNPQDPGSLGLIRHGDQKYDLVLIGQDRIERPVLNKHLREQTQMESWHWRAFQVPSTIPPGKYQVVINGRPKGLIQVVHAPQVKIVRLSPGERQNSLTARSGEQIRGYGCTMTGNLAVNPGCTIVGLTIDGNVTGSFDNVVFDSCVFRRGQIGPFQESDRGCLFRDCRFENATCATCSSGCFLRCLWLGRPSMGGHNFCNERSTRLAVIDGVFQRTDRGLILRSMWGPNSDNLYAGIQFENINATPNGGELICVEGSGTGFNRNLIFALRQSGCVGGVSLFDSIASDNLFDNIRVPVDVCGLNRQTGNIIQDSECDYVRINWPNDKGGYNSGASNTLLRYVACVGFKPSARGLASGDPKYYTPGQFRAVVEDGSPTPTTRAIGLTVSNQAQGFAQKIGVTE